MAPKLRILGFDLVHPQVSENVTPLRRRVKAIQTAKAVIFNTDKKKTKQNNWLDFFRKCLCILILQSVRIFNQKFVKCYIDIYVMM